MNILTYLHALPITKHLHAHTLRVGYQCENEYVMHCITLVKLSESYQ